MQNIRTDTTYAETTLVRGSNKTSCVGRKSNFKTTKAWTTEAKLKHPTHDTWIVTDD